MLKYIENTTNKNVVNQDIASIPRLVDWVKRKKEVNISYMKSWEIEKMIRKEGYDEGYGEGHDEGYEECRDRVNLLITKLNEAGRLQDIVKAAGDKAYQESLFEELGL